MQIYGISYFYNLLNWTVHPWSVPEAYYTSESELFVLSPYPWLQQAPCTTWSHPMSKFRVFVERVLYVVEAEASDPDNMELYSELCELELVEEIE